MKKLTQGYIDCLIRGVIKGHIWDEDLSYTGKSFQRNERYIPKLEQLGLIEKAETTIIEQPLFKVD